MKNYPQEIKNIKDLEDLLWDKQLYIGDEKVGYIESFLFKIIRNKFCKPYILSEKVKLKKVVELSNKDKEVLKDRFIDFMLDTQSDINLVFDIKNLQQDIDSIISKLKIEKTESVTIKEYDVSLAVEKIKNSL